MLAYDQVSAPTSVEGLTRALGSADPARALWDLARQLRAPRSLAELGMQKDDIDPIAAQIIAHPYANPAPITHDDVVQLLRAAWSGEPPSTSR